MWTLIVFFIAYSCVVFAFSNVWVLLGFSIFNILLIIILRCNIKRVLKNLCGILLFALFVFAFNLIFDSLISSLITAWKILIVTNFAFVFSYRLSPVQIANGISGLLFPLKLFGIKTQNFVIIIVIALNFIPIIKQEILSLRQNLKCRNVKFNLKTLFTKSHIILTLYFAGLIKKTEDLEIVLRTRNYQA